MGNLQVDLGLVQYDSDSLLSPVPLAAQISLAAGAAVIILSVLVVILMYRYRRPFCPFTEQQSQLQPFRPAGFVFFACAFRRKSKQALRDYKKVLLQLETLEINVGDQCRKEFTGTGRQHCTSTPFYINVTQRWAT